MISVQRMLIDVKQFKCPKIEAQMNWVWYSHAVEFYVTIINVACIFKGYRSVAIDI